jgi:hypothetical protein
MDALQSVFGEPKEALELVLSQFDVPLLTIVATIAAALLFTLSSILLVVRTDRLAERVEMLVQVVEALKRFEEARLYRELALSARRTKKQAGNDSAGEEELRTDRALKAGGLV